MFETRSRSLYPSRVAEPSAATTCAVQMAHVSLSSQGTCRLSPGPPKTSSLSCSNRLHKTERVQPNDPRGYTERIATHPNPRIFLSAGEASGDHYGAAIIERLRGPLPGALFTGLGGAEMRAQGQQQVVRAEDVAVMGITEILLHIPKILLSYRRLVRSVRESRPDVAILIDFPDVNFRLAKHLHRAGVPVIWFVSPQLWAWKRGRLRWVQQRVANMLVIFPFEEIFYRSRNVAAQFVGHPLAEQALPTSSREEYAARYGLDAEKPWIGLLPGSRWKEIRANLPVLHELAIRDLIGSHSSSITFDGEQLELPSAPNTRYEFLLPVASTIRPEALQAYLDELTAESLRYFSESGQRSAAPRITLVPDAREALYHSRASVVASGTATIQAAVIGNPFVIVYRVSALTYALARKLVSYPEEFPDMRDGSGNLPIGMVNLIAQQRLVPELLQEHFSAENVAAELGPLLEDSPERQAQIAGLAEVRRLLQGAPGSGSSMDRVAKAVLQALEL